MKDLATKANQVTERFLERRGFDIIERVWEKDEDAPVAIIAEEDDAIVFVKVQYRADGDAFPREELDQEAFEVFACKFLTEHKDDYVDRSFRFDVVAILIVSEDRAIIRHHINCMSEECVPAEE